MTIYLARRPVVHVSAARVVLGDELVVAAGDGDGALDALNAVGVFHLGCEELVEGGGFF